MAAYPLARMEFRGKRIVFGMVVATLFVPPVILVIPNHLIVGQPTWLDTLVASVPVLILYVFAQRFIIEGVSRSGVKG